MTRSTRWLAAAHAVLIAVLSSELTRRVPEPYMDEPFHLGQTRAYCAGRFDVWDDKITTFPGLYLVLGQPSAWLRALVETRRWPSTMSTLAACTLPTLRFGSMLPALWLPAVLSELIAHMHPDLGASDVAANVAVLVLLPTHFFFHFLYYTDTAATCSVLVLLYRSMLGVGARPTRRGALGVLLSAVLALGFRQTNAVWIAFCVASVALRDLEAAGLLRLRDGRGLLGSLREALEAMLRRRPLSAPAPHPVAPAMASWLREERIAAPALPWLLAKHAAPLLLLAGFGAFVVVNGGVVVGDRSNHQPALHGAQLLYLTAYAAAPFSLPQLTAGLPRTLREAAAAARAAPAGVAAAAALALALAATTLCHPFLLADNRHVTFYVWRHVLGKHRAARYVLAPAYVLLGWRLYPPVWRAHGPLIGAGLLACAALVLVPSPLLEPRYLTLPCLMLRLHAPMLRGPREWLPPLLAFVALNAAMLGIFLYRPYVWGDGTTARFMW